MGTEPSQALTLICDYDKSKFYIISVDMKTLEVLDIPADLNWAMVVVYHRGRMEKIKGTPIYNNHHFNCNGNKCSSCCLFHKNVFIYLEHMKSKVNVNTAQRF